MDPQKLQQALLMLISLILSICVHEFGHAFVADKLGDPLPRSQGRVTLNPLAHIDPIGTIVFPLIAFFGMPVIGWGKPVQISLHPAYMTRKVSIRTAHALVAIAGPAMNIVFALVLSLAFVILYRGGYDSYSLAVANVIGMNVGLCFFNLLPMPPLDGGAVLARILPRSAAPVLELINRYGFILLFGLLWLGALRYILGPAYALEESWLGLLRHWAIR